MRYSVCMAMEQCTGHWQLVQLRTCSFKTQSNYSNYYLECSPPSVSGKIKKQLNNEVSTYSAFCAKFSSKFSLHIILHFRKLPTLNLLLRVEAYMLTSQFLSSSLSTSRQCLPGTGKSPAQSPLLKVYTMLFGNINGFVLTTCLHVGKLTLKVSHLRYSKHSLSTCTLMKYTLILTM